MPSPGHEHLEEIIQKAAICNLNESVIMMINISIWVTNSKSDKEVNRLFIRLGKCLDEIFYLRFGKAFQDKMLKTFPQNQP